MRPEEPQPFENDFISLTLAQLASSKFKESNSSELDIYLQSATTADRDILDFWRAYEAGAHALSQIDKDVLSSAISSVGPEQLFSVRRLVYPHQRNRLVRRTIKRLMVVRHHEKLMWVVEDNETKNISALKRKFNFCQDEYDNLNSLSLSDDDVADDSSEDELPVNATRTRRKTKGRGRRHSRRTN